MPRAHWRSGVDEYDRLERLPLPDLEHVGWSGPEAVKRNIDLRLRQATPVSLPLNSAAEVLAEAIEQA